MPQFLDPWPAPDEMWAEPPWLMSGTSITAWYESDPIAVAKNVSPSFVPMVGEKGVRTRIRFYDVDFQPTTGDDAYRIKMSGKFREAVIAFKGSISGIEGEYSAFMWTNHDGYMSWGREIFGWPLMRGSIELAGSHWGEFPSERSISQIQGDGFHLQIIGNSSLGQEIPIRASSLWLTPRKIIFPAGEEAERRDLLIVRPKIIQAGQLFHHEGEFNFIAAEGSPIAGLGPIGDYVIHRHHGFTILVGHDVEIIRGVGDKSSKV
jgi:hypothetical protein